MSISSFYKVHRSLKIFFQSQAEVSWLHRSAILLLENISWWNFANAPCTAILDFNHMTVTWLWQQTPKFSLYILGTVNIVFSICLWSFYETSRKSNSKNDKNINGYQFRSEYLLVSFSFSKKMRLCWYFLYTHKTMTSYVTLIERTREKSAIDRNRLPTETGDWTKYRCNLIVISIGLKLPLR